MLVSYEQVTKVDGVKNDADKKDEVQSGRSFEVQAKPGSEYQSVHLSQAIG